MIGTVPLGRVLGVRVGLHYSWFFIAGLMLLSLAPMFRRWEPGWPDSLVLLSAAGTVLLFFTGLLVHELAHAAAAARFGVPVRGITLFALGGMAESGAESPSAGAEFWIGVVGPLTSAVIGGACLGLASLIGPIGPVPSSLLQGALTWLGAINLAIAAFNMIPAYPLDGGRLLRAAAWRWSGSRDQATRLAARVGQAVGMAFIALGVLRFLGGAGLGGLWLAFIGFFLVDAASASHLQASLRDRLADLRVADLMSRDVPVADGEEDLEEFVEARLLRGPGRLYLVREDGRGAGVITSRDVRRVPAGRRHGTKVRQAAVPVENAPAVPPGATALDALELMARRDLEELPVLEGGEVTGVLTREDILHALKNRRELARP